jgi:tetratricopeptide (TPR) repeat protein
MMRIKAGRGYPRAVELLQTALRRYLAAGDTRSAGVVHSRLGGALSTHYSAMDIPRALDHFAAAERLLPVPASVFHLQRGQAQAAMFGLRTELLADSAERLRSIAATLGRRDLTVLAGWAESWAALNQGRLAHAEATWERTWDVAHELADPYLGWLAVNDAALALNAYLLDPGAARRWCRRGLGQPQLTRLTHPHGAVLDQLVLALASMGELATASEAAVSLPADAVSRRLLLFLDGHWEDAEASWAAAAEADAGVGDRHDLALNLRWLAACRSVLGNPQEAVSTLDRVVDLAVDGPQLPTELDARAELARLLAADDPNQAGTHLRRCEEILDATGEDWRGLTGQVEVARAVVAGATGDVASSTAAFTRAVQTFEAYELPWRQADALAEWGRRLGEPERLDTAAAVYASIGAAARWRTLVKAR